VSPVVKSLRAAEPSRAASHHRYILLPGSRVSMRKYDLLLIPLLMLLLAAASAAQLHQIAIIEIPGRPGFDALAFAKGQLVIAHRGANSVDIFNPTLRRLKKQITGMSDPRGIAVDDSAGRVYVANAGSNSLAVISTANWNVVQNIPLQHSPDSLLLYSGKLYIGNWDNDSVSVLDLEKGNHIATVAVDGRPEHMVADPATGLVFVNVEDPSQVVALDAHANIARRYPVAASQPTGLAIDARQRRLFVAVRYAVLVLNADSGAEIKRIPAEAGTDSLWFDPSNGALYAAATDGSIKLIATGSGGFISENELKTDVRGHTLAFDPARKMVYMPGGREGRSKIVILKRVETPAVNFADQPAPPPTQTAEKK
jgi:YVTN family beta-propeller protein